MVLIYLLIVVNFQSWLDPFIIITALPGALAGIAWSLFLTHTNLSVPALTGAIMCMGTARRIRSWSSLMRASAWTCMATPCSQHSKRLCADSTRHHDGVSDDHWNAADVMSNSQNAPLGRAVIGGLIVATFATLLFVPCVYAIVYKRGRGGKETA